MSNYLCELETAEDGIYTLWINRIDVKNAFNAELIQQLTSVLENLRLYANCRGLILRGRGDFFCAGADLKWMKDAVHYTEEENLRDANKLADLMHTLDTLPFATIAYASGGAFGGGMGLLSCCDIVIAEKNTKFCLSEVKLGLVAAVISPYVVRAMGQRHARRYFMTAEIFNADEAYRIGLVHEVVNDEKAGLEKLEVIKNHLLTGGPEAIYKSKQLLKYLEYDDFDAVKEHTTHLIASVRLEAEAQEGLDAFLSKRKAKWVKNV